MMRPLLLVSALLLAGVYGALAQGCVPSTSRPELDSGDTPAGHFYVDDDCFPVIACNPGPLFSIWIYQETNGIPGLQRGDEMVDDTCQGQIPRDTIIF